MFLANSSFLDNYVILYEHTQLDVSLENEDVTFLRREFPGKLDVWQTSISDIYTVSAHQYVGFVVLPTGRIIEVRPKISIGVLFAMLAKVHHLVEFGVESVVHSSVLECFEFIVNVFVGMVEDLVARGILRGFEVHQDKLSMLRGKVLLAETIRRCPVVRNRHFCKFTEFTSDVIENQILKLTCQKLTTYHYRHLLDLNNRLWRLLCVFSDVQLIAWDNEFFTQLTYHRLNEHYRPVLDVARLLLAYLSPSGARGSHAFLSYLVDMNILFERYVTAVLQETNSILFPSGDLTDIRVMGQDRHILDLAGQIYIRPDVVIYSNGVPVLAVDAKYKCEHPNSDIYQALAYSHALRIPHTVLAYPASEGIVPQRYRIQPDGSKEVILFPLNLAGGLAELRQQTKVFLQSVWQEVQIASSRPSSNN